MNTLALGMPGGWEWLIIGAIGLLIFGRRLPEVGRSLGRSIVEFKRGIKGVQDEIEAESSKSESTPEFDERRQPALGESEKWEQGEGARTQAGAKPANE